MSHQSIRQLTEGTENKCGGDGDRVPHCSDMHLAGGHTREDDKIQFGPDVGLVGNRAAVTGRTDKSIKRNQLATSGLLLFWISDPIF